MSNKFTVTENEVRGRDGDSYSVDKYKEGEDYVLRKCFKSHKRMFRSDILGASVAESSLVEPKQEPSQEPSADESQVQECKIKRLYPNPRYVETDKGRVFVGGKGHLLKVGQIIRVLNGELVIKAAGKRHSLVRI